MAKKTVVAGSTVSASQLKDFFRQIDDGSINGEYLQSVLDHKYPAEVLKGAKTGLSVTSDGRTGEQFIRDLEAARYNVGDYAKQLLRNKKFVATNGVTYDLVVIKGDECSDAERVTSKIRAEAERRGYLKPSLEHAALFRELISDEEIERMGLWALIVMHEPVTDSDGSPCVLGVVRYGDGRWLRAYDGNSDYRWNREHGFVFLLPQD